MRGVPGAAGVKTWPCEADGWVALGVVAANNSEPINSAAAAGVRRATHDSMNATPKGCRSCHPPASAERYKTALFAVTGELFSLPLNEHMLEHRKRTCQEKSFKGIAWCKKGLSTVR